jgi:glycosyltransferase involved in cell wall biosynthesis
VTPAFVPATRLGGPIQSVHGLCQALATHAGVQVTVLALEAPADRERRRRLFADGIVPGPPVVFVGTDTLAGGLAGLAKSLRLLLGEADLLHLTGVFSPPTPVALWAARRAGRPLVWSPRGALQEWGMRRRRRLKEVWVSGIERIARPASTTLHFTSALEAQESRRHLHRLPAFVEPNGVDVAPWPSNRRWRPEGVLRLLFLGRLHQVKNVDGLLAALPHIRGEVVLTICGPAAEEERGRLEDRARDVATPGKRVVFGEPVERAARDALFGETDILVLPSLSESFGLVVAEALAHGVPAVASRSTPWEGLGAHGCGVWCEGTPEGLAQAVNMLAETDLAEAGRRGRLWVEEELSWPRVAVRMRDRYLEAIQVLGGVR